MPCRDMDGTESLFLLLFSSSHPSCVVPARVCRTRVLVPFPLRRYLVQKIPLKADTTVLQVIPDGRRFFLQAKEV